MTIYSLYIYDRHCNCIYYQDWHRVKRPKPAVEGNLLPAVSQAVAPRTSDSSATQTSSFSSPRNTLTASSGVVVALADLSNLVSSPTAVLSSATPPPAPPQQPTTGLPFDEEAKLVYGVILSLRNMVKKLSGREEHFLSYRTTTYKLHLYETLSGYKFVMLSDPQADSLRFVLRQIYIGPFIEYVVRNPLSEMDSREHGIDNDYFRSGTDRLLRSLSVFN